MCERPDYSLRRTHSRPGHSTLSCDRFSDTGVALAVKERIATVFTMENANTVTVAGHIGSGKTAVCRQLQVRTGWEIVSAGAILRSMAVQHGMSVLEFNEYAKSHPAIDQQIDSYIRSLASRPGQRIVDSRLAWHFLPMSHKVFLVVEPTVGAARV